MNKSEEVLKKFHDEYVQTIPTKIQELESLIEALETELSKENLKNLRMKVHKIAGSAGTYGFDGVTHLSLKFEQDVLHLLENFTPQHIDFIKQCRTYMNDLKKEFFYEDFNK